MQKIQKFQFGRLYVAPKSTKTYELVDRDGHHLAFRVRNPRTRDSWKQIAISTYKADASGAFEEVLLSDGVRLRADAWRGQRNKCRIFSGPVLKEIVAPMTKLAA